MDVLREGTRRANAVAEETLALAKQAMKQDYFGRRLDDRVICSGLLLAPGTASRRAQRIMRSCPPPRHDLRLPMCPSVGPCGA